VKREDNYILKHLCENKPERRRGVLGEKREILSAFQWIIHGIYRKLNQESRPQMRSICCLFSYFYSRIQWKRKIIRRKRMQRLKRALAVDILVIPCHIKIPSVTLFFWRLKIKHEGKLTAHTVKLADKDYLLFEVPQTGSSTNNSKCSRPLRKKVDRKSLYL